MARNILILTGAGISAESGLGTFRDTGGMWSRYALEDVATPQGFARDPALVHHFYNARRANCLAARPNAAHYALARLETDWPGRLTIVTQNIDDLHERAGSRAVIHMHGEVMRALCAACSHRWDAPPAMSRDLPCPACAAAASRPDVVWFGEMPYHMDRIETLLQQADLFVAIGTSGTVYPAAGFVEAARAMDIETLELTLEPSAASELFDEARHGPATRLVPDWANGLLSGN